MAFASVSNTLKLPVVCPSWNNHTVSRMERNPEEAVIDRKCFRSNATTPQRADESFKVRCPNKVWN
jgi:hypothetical protein